jgi:hypothetical protein
MFPSNDRRGWYSRPKPSHHASQPRLDESSADYLAWRKRSSHIRIELPRQDCPNVRGSASRPSEKRPRAPRRLDAPFSSLIVVRPARVSPLDIPAAGCSGQRFEVDQKRVEVSGPNHQTNGSVPPPFKLTRGEWRTARRCDPVSK